VRDARSDVIYDVGLFNGDDTAYYLFQGYKVVAIDANPLMIEKARTRFAKELGEKRLTLVNAGISAASGTADFWISDLAEWSSFDRSIASRSGVKHRSVPVPVVPFAQVLEEHGVPRYLKIDIEGNDRLCVEALIEMQLPGMQFPAYISVESECVGDSEILAPERSLAMLELLQNAGYRRFKLVSQYDFSAVRSSASERFLMRVVNSLSRGKLRVPGLAGIAGGFSDSARIAALGFKFSPGSSGPWGEDIPGDWMPFGTAKSAYLSERRAFFARAGRSPYSFWYDWHAKC
jgi:FkbM family methyltransferase